MSGAPSHDVTRLRQDWKQGDQAAFERLLPIVYRELHKLAGGYLRRERSDHPLQPTALIHEAYLRLVKQDLPEWNSRSHFYGVAAQLMRPILVEPARARAAEKRGGGGEKLPLDDLAELSVEKAADLIALDDALARCEEALNNLRTSH
jgi:RNA polymerase sigma factor (TIGR02999 family)